MKNNLYEFYSNHYDLKVFDEAIFEKKFAFLIYDEKGNYYFNKNEIIQKDTVSSILNLLKEFKIEYGIDVINYYPVCFYKQTLVIAFKIKSVNCILNKISYINLDNKYIELIKYNIKEYGNLFLSKNVLNEINMSQKNIRRYIIHEKIIKKYLLTEKKRRKKEFKNLINDLIPKAQSIIDISCGDNSDIFDICKKKHFDTIVGNDICVNYLKSINDDDVIFTNENVELNRFKASSFDVSYCKNTLHHMNNLTNINNMISFLKKISDNIIIIEIENPNINGGLPKFLNRYLYGWFLKDVGKCYLNYTQFQNIIEDNFDDKKNYEIKYSKFKNILGDYMIAKVSRRK